MRDIVTLQIGGAGNSIGDAVSSGCNTMIKRET